MFFRSNFAALEIVYCCRAITWLFWDLQLRWTFRRCLHYVRRRLTTTYTSLLWYDYWRRRVDGLYKSLF